MARDTTVRVGATTYDLNAVNTFPGKVITRPIRFWSPGTNPGSPKTAGAHTFTNPTPTLLPVGAADANRKMWLHKPNHPADDEASGGGAGGLAFDWYVIDTDVGGSANDGIAYSEGRSAVGGTVANLEDYFKPSAVESAAIGGTWGRKQTVECIVRTGAATTPSAGMSTGFGLGFIDALDFFTTANDPFVVLFIDWNVPSWKLLVAGGTLPTTPTIVTLTGVQTPAINKLYDCQILFNPDDGYAAALVCGVEGARITTAQATFPSKTFSGYCGFTMFAFTGTSAGLVRVGFGFPQVSIYGFGPLG